MNATTQIPTALASETAGSPAVGTALESHATPATAPETAPAPAAADRAVRSDQPAQPHRHLLLALRADLLAPVEAIVGYSQMLLADTAAEAAERPPPFRADLEDLLASAKDLYRFVKEHLEAACRGTAADVGFSGPLRSFRHDIGNRLTHVQGLCQLLLMSERDEFFGQFTEDLEKIERCCKTCIVALLHYQGADAAPLDAAAESQPVTPAGPEPRGPLRPATAGGRAAAGPAAVLVADDNELSREVLVRVLQRDGHQVTVASNGREALELLEQQDFDLALLDFLMPELSGFQVLQELKLSERLRHTPVIMVSALDTLPDVVPCIELGADDFLTKPVDLALFQARVNACLEKKRLREREYGQFFTPELARQYVRHPERLMVARDAEVTVMFCDIRGFSRISERLGPAELVGWLSDVMATLSDCVIEHRGALVDYIGDGLVAMWGAPEPQPEHAELACRAALDMLNRLPELSRRWQDQIHDATAVGIGLNTGMARVGNSGSPRKFKYGPLGNMVTVASRVQGATKYLRTNLLATGPTLHQLGGRFPARRVCRVRVVNVRQPVELYEILPLDGPQPQSLRDRYEAALTEFENTNCLGAARILGQLLVDEPTDGPTLMLMKRVVDELLEPRPEFDPAWELPGK
jgi:class 3 adenylate cyclase